MHVLANSDNRIDWTDVFDTESSEERRLRIRNHAFDSADLFDDSMQPQAEGGDFALVWPHRSN